ncbi:MAG: phosphatidate cytidylyltransferase [Alphaproteobacteria bacterium]|nr:phosphatidate cytidylyltransferase [Alphaproteobacteria bacterium]
MEKFKNFFTGTNKRLRMTMAVVMLGIAYLFASFGFIGLCSLILIISTLMIYEFNKLFNPKLGLKFVWDEISIIGVLTLFFLNRIVWHVPNYYFSIALVGLFCSSMLANIASNREHWILESITPLYIGFGVMAILYSYLYSSIMALIYMFIITISTDTGAFFIGSSIGGPKLWVRISPKKTWSGAIGGILCAFAFGTTFILNLLWTNSSGDFTSLSLWGAISLGLSFFSQCGDLFESWLKRLNGIKDSSNLIPGHGGFLDRFDSILFVAPVMALILAFAKVGALGL